jgi:hypothetical protein
MKTKLTAEPSFALAGRQAAIVSGKPYQVVPLRRAVSA